MVDFSEGMWNLALQPLKKLYLHFHIAYGHQTWQSGNLSYRAANNKVTWPFDHVVLQDHVTDLKHIPTTRVPMVIKLGRIVTYSCRVTLRFGHMLLQNHVIN